MIAVLIKTQK